MKSKKIRKTLCFILAAGVFLSTPFNPNLYRAYADETPTVESSLEEVYDGVYDEWKLDEQCTKGGEKLEVVKGKLNFASGPNNGNGAEPGSYPAVALNPHEFNFNEAGHFSFKLESNSGGKEAGVYLGYKDPGNGLFIGRSSAMWYYNMLTDGKGKDKTIVYNYLLGRAKETVVDISWTEDKKITVKLNGKPYLENMDSSGYNWGSNKIALKAGTGWFRSVTDVNLSDIKYSGQKPTMLKKYVIKVSVTDEDGNHLTGADVFVDGKKMTELEAETGRFNLKLIKGRYSLKIEKEGYDTVEKDISVDDNLASDLSVKLENPNSTKVTTISSEDMMVTVDTTFPRVDNYLMKKEGLKDKVFYGQPEYIRTIRINGRDIRLKKEDVTSEILEDRINYTLHVKDGNDIDADIKAVIKVEKNTLAFEVTEITNNLEENSYPVQTVGIPNHSLISVREGQENFNFRGALMSSNTTIDGDEEHNTIPRYNNADFMYAFISADGMSAGLWSNSENEGRNKASYIKAGGASNTRVIAQTGVFGDKNTLSLSSPDWYYHRVVTDSHRRSFIVSETELPKAKIIITGDENGDKIVDWQDGAIAFRSIMNNPFKSEEVPELVAHRIAMNFGGQAQNPFLTTLDNVKRVAMHTDGLGQSIILKGYANEGHDSGHPDYYDIGKRIGGVKDMNTLMEKGKELGARFGIHINCGEMYPESKAFSDESVRRDQYNNLMYGWNWIDQGVGLDSLYDLATGNREGRFNKLKDLVKDNLDFIYVDIWGNTTGGDDDTWQTRKLSKEINDRGWRMTTEWGPTNEYDSTFQHWAADLTYGDKKSKGENSVLMRFLRNHQKDSWVANYHRYGGAALAPLLGGYNMKDFEGWQGRNDYDAYIQNLYEHNLTTKFIQHFKIVKWETGSPFYTFGDSYTPDRKITLKNDEGDVLVLERASDDANSQDYYKRTITLNGKVIATGAEPEIYTGKGDESYLLPWIWDAATGNRVTASEEKLYHFNNQAGETTWDLPESWKNTSEVKIYKLTDLGKTEEKTLPVVEGRITITAEAKQPYVIYKASKTNMAIKWSEGMHLVDAGFNSGNLDSWTKTGTGGAEIAKSQFSNPMLKLTGEVTMSQKLTDLTPGERYAVLVGVDNRSDAKAVISITDGDKKLAENYTIRSIARNYVQAYTHNTSSATVDGTSYFQNMYVFFTAPESGEALLTLSKQEGEGESYFDDVRVVESEADNITFDKNGEISKFTQDFEKNVQGLYPFVVGGIENVQDNRIHLSELHAPYTQAGWDVKKMDDVLEGNWSVKINGLTGSNAVAFQTIPQNFRFEPGVKYHVSFKYQAGTEGIYAVVKGIGEDITSDAEPLKYSLGTDAMYETDIVGDESGQTWFGICSTSKAADTQGNSGAAANFGGYQDFVLDDLVIERIDENYTEEELKTLIEKSKEDILKENLSSTNYKKAQEAIAKAEVALKEDGKNQKSINIAYNNLDTLMKSLIGSSSEANPEDGANDLPLDGMIAETGSFQPGYTGEGPASYVLDNNPGTIWHTEWDGTEIENMWLKVTLKEAATITGVRLLQRTGSKNGRIKEADIQVLKEGETEFKTVKRTELDTNGWNLVTFDTQENVTAVMIKALSTDGGKADEVNRFASLAEVRVVKKAEAESEKPDKTSLLALITKAEETLATKSADNDVTVLEEKIKAAQAVYANEEAGLVDILLAEANLKNVIKELDAGKYSKKTEKPDDNSGKQPDEKPGENPGEKPGETPGENPGEKPGENPGENPGEKQGENPGEKPGEKPGENPDRKQDVNPVINESSNSVPVIFVQNKPSETVTVGEDDTAKGIINTGNESVSNNISLNIIAHLKNYRKDVKNDKKFKGIKEKLSKSISYLEKKKITTTENLLKRLEKLRKELKKLKAAQKNAKNMIKIGKIQKEISSIKLVISSLKSAKKFYNK